MTGSPFGNDFVVSGLVQNLSRATGDESDRILQLIVQQGEDCVPRLKRMNKRRSVGENTWIRSDEIFIKWNGTRVPLDSEADVAVKSWEIASESVSI
jgi:hypothetical protein